MELTLTFEGRIPAQRSDLGVIWTMRRSFSSQLEKVWGKPPFEVLRKWEDSGFAAGAPKFTRILADTTYIPLYGLDVGVGVDLEITLLTGMPTQKSVISSGDLDNRIKRIIDALRVPQGKGELQSDALAKSRCYCLVEDDNAVLALRAKLGPYLGSNDPSVSFAIIRARPVAINVTLQNLAMLH
jgi:hypothetical protein